MRVKKEMFWIVVFVLYGCAICSLNHNSPLIIGDDKTNVENLKSFAEQFEICGHMQTKLQLYIPSLNDQQALFYYWYIHSPEYRQACLEVQ